MIWLSCRFCYFRGSHDKFWEVLWQLSSRERRLKGWTYWYLVSNALIIMFPPRDLHQMTRCIHTHSCEAKDTI